MAKKSFVCKKLFQQPICILIYLILIFFVFFKKKSLIDERKNLQTIYFNVLSTHE